MRDVMVIGVGMTRFAKSELTLRELAAEAVTAALGEADLAAADVDAAFVGNAVAGLVTGQEMIRGQVMLRPLGFEGLPIVNVENACASASTALHLGWQSVAGGVHDVVLCLGAEKLTHEDRTRGIAAIGTAVDLESRAELAREYGIEPGESRSLFMDLYASWAAAYMARAGATQRDFAGVAVKAHANGARNPRAQYGSDLTIDDVLEAREVVWPLTLPMCSPISDGAAAVVLASADGARRLGRRGPRVAASILVSGAGRESTRSRSGSSTSAACRRAYAAAGIGPEDLDVIELHDATAPAELILYEELGLAPVGRGAELLASGRTSRGGAQPGNPSGGLLAKGHPIGATGIAQVCELVWQLRGEADDRQVDGARIGLAHNAGGWLDGDNAVCAVHILTTEAAR